MARSDKDRIQFIRAALQGHTDFWDEQRPQMRRYRNAYMTQFYEDVDLVDDTQLRVETADGYAAIESLMGSLFTKYPAVEVAPDITGKGDVAFTKAVANNWIKSARGQVENASRMALIYTHSFLKLAPRESTTLLGKVAMRAVPPWQVILDRDAAAWEDSRFIGHVYYISVDEANDKFGNKKWTGAAQKDYFTDYERNTDRSYRSYGDSPDLPNEYLYIEIVEMYDFINNELVFWSSHWKSGGEVLDRSAIPVMTFDGRPLSNIVPFYFSRRPDRPMEGYSAMSRIYDQIFEKNILRTFWANAVRRDSRQYIYKEGAFDEEVLAKITAGVDGAMVPTDSDTLTGLIDIVPNAPISSNHAQYLNYIEQDIQKGSLTAGFTRGDASRATATEVTALMQYTASELGKMARDRDSTIEQAVSLYVRMLIPLIEEGESVIVSTTDGAKVGNVSKLDADWEFYATDGGGTPLTDAVKKQQLIQLFPVLQQLGIPPEKMKEEIVRLFDLPDAFNEALPVPAAAPIGTPAGPPAPTPDAGTVPTSDVIGGV
jgi:hypothetical protein